MHGGLHNRKMNSESFAYISLGGNQGQEEKRFAFALNALCSVPGVRLRALSRIYRTEPQGQTDQPWFHNQVAALGCTRLSAQNLLRELLCVETELGRRRETGQARFGPRPIDLDLLLFESIVCATEFLTLPHPRMAERAFVLIPLLELDSDVLLPDGRRCAELLARISYRLVDDRIFQRS